MKFVRLAVRSVVEFFRDDGLMLAASLSYFGMMAVVPFGLFLVAIVGQVLGSSPGLYHFF